MPGLILRLWVRGNHLLKRSRLRWFNLQYGSGCSWTSVPTKAGFSIFRSRSFPVSGGPGPDPPREEQAKNSACNRNAWELFEVVREGIHRNGGMKWQGKPRVEYYNLLPERYIRLRRRIPRETVEAPLLG